MSKPSSPPKTRDVLLRGLPVELADKLKVAASLYKTPLRGYIVQILQDHVRGLEKKGLVLSLPKGKREERTT